MSMIEELSLSFRFWSRSRICAWIVTSSAVVGKKVEELYNIPGSVPNPVNMPNYCYFRDRCEMRCDQCDGRYPPEIRISDTHVVSCYRFFETGEVLDYPKSVNVEEL